MRRVTLALCLFLSFHVSASAQVINDTQRIKELLCGIQPPPNGVFQYTIDLSNGLTTGRTRYKVDDQVQLIFKNKNPFVYDYAFKVEEREIPEPALNTFFKAYNTSPTATLAALAAQTAPTVALSEDPECAALRPTLVNRETRYMASYDRLRQLAPELVLQFKELRADVTSEENDLKQQSECEALVQEALEVTELLETTFDESKPKSLGSKLKQFHDDLGSFEVDLRDQALGLARFKQLDCSARGTFESNLQAAREKLESEDPPGLRKATREFDAAAKELKTKGEKISDVLQSRNNFTVIQEVGDYDTITEVTITIDRGLRPAPPSLFTTKKLRFGGRQRFVLAAGAAFSPLDLITYKAVQGTKPGAAGAAPTVIRVVGLDQESSQRVAPLIMLHTRFNEGWRAVSGFHFSFGFAGQFGDNGANLEYLLGLSTSFAEERAFVTLGAYNGRIQKLGNGFKLGDELPTAVTDPPVSKGRDWDWGFAFTYKFR